MQSDVESTSANLASMSKRFHATAPGTLSPIASLAAIVRKPSAKPSQIVSRTQAHAVTPVTTIVSTPFDLSIPASSVP